MYTQSSYDDSEFGLEEAIRSAKEKHQRAIELYHKEIQELDEKRAAMARQGNRMRTDGDMHMPVEETAQRRNTAELPPQSPRRSGGAAFSPPQSSYGVNGVSDQYARAAIPAAQRNRSLTDTRYDPLARSPLTGQYATTPRNELGSGDTGNPTARRS
jgi:hypothetical protein